VQTLKSTSYVKAHGRATKKKDPYGKPPYQLTYYKDGNINNVLEFTFLEVLLLQIKQEPFNREFFII